MLGKKTPTPKIDEAVTKSINFELTIADIARRSERRAWWVASSAIGMAVILAGGYFFMLPLKEKAPYLVMADAYTGTSTVARLDGDIVDQRISTSEAINRSNVAHFVLARESYDVTMINLHDWATVLTMAAPDVAAAYQTLYVATNPENPYKLYGKDRAIRTNILSIVLMGGGNGQPYKGATVRFQRSLYDKRTGATQPLDNKIATLAFAYKPNLKMDEKYRIENPLGFQITSYRVDSDYATTPPAVTGSGLTSAQDAEQDNADQNAQPTVSAQSQDIHVNNTALQTNLAAPPPIPEQEASQPPTSAAPTSRQNVQGAGRR
ncbi:type IV secretion system protein [Dyella dinghuensis]|uniref:Type IV secretion system protein n=1 Tax=Dyella dinghuensis TaxID=1920169 RepID=A0A432LWU0_9GAMM|nr:type IV secretion system protein [Dyella dinghuensis]RUL66568.1 type IV secretion system protein [Dyella dinghuensis]